MPSRGMVAVCMSVSCLSSATECHVISMQANDHQSMVHRAPCSSTDERCLGADRQRLA